MMNAARHGHSRALHSWWRDMSSELPRRLPEEAKEFPMRIVHILAATVAAGAVAVPAAAQTYYPQAQPQYQYPQAQPQPYPGQPGYGYQQQGHAYPGQPAYGSNPIEQIIGQLLGNRYNVSDRTAVSRCATAAVAQAQRQYAPRRAGYATPYGNAYGYNQPNNPHYGYTNAHSQMRVTSITDVQRRSGNRGLRVTGQMSSGMHAMAHGQHGYGQQGYGYQGQRRIDPRYAQAADLSFRCNVDARGNVSGIRVSENRAVAYRR